MRAHTYAHTGTRTACLLQPIEPVERGPTEWKTTMEDRAAACGPYPYALMRIARMRGRDSAAMCTVRAKLRSATIHAME